MLKSLPQLTDLEVLSINHVRSGSVTDFDVFLLVGGYVVIYATSMYRWEQGEIARLKREGHVNLYVPREQMDLVEAYKQLSIVSDIDESLPPAERITNLTDVAAEFNKVLFENELSQSSLMVGKEIASAMVRCIQEDRASITALGKLAHHDEYTYYHSGRVAAYAIAIALQMGLTDSYSLTELSLGSLLHDIGKARIDLEVLNKQGHLTPDEYLIVKKHPEYGIEMVSGAILTAVPKEIILHHHERMDGSGYPYGINGRHLLAEVKISSFADCFDALTTNRPYQPARSRFDALQLIKHNLLHALDPDAFEALITILHGREIDRHAI